MKRLLTLTAILLSTGLSAQNPIIRDQYTADPTARVFGGKVWLFPSHDIISPVEPEKKWFCMEDYHAFSSEDLVHWTDHGIILTQENVPWGKKDGYSMWAPDCVEKDGKYYFVFPDAPMEGRGFAIGVAVADAPEGPYTPYETPIPGVFGIDPCVLQASDGNTYLFWSGSGLQGALVKDDLSKLAGQPVRLDATLPAGFKEGPFAFEKDGKYYLTYPWVQDRTETLAYAMSNKPLGPYEFKGIIMAQSPSECWTNHHSIVQYNGEWYIFYHHNDYSPAFDKNRSVRIDRLYFNPDGTIQPVTPTFRGVGVTPKHDSIQIDRYSAICHHGAYIEFLDAKKPFDGWYVCLTGPGTWVRYDDVDFGQVTPKTVAFRYKARRKCTVSLSAGDASREFRLRASRKWKTVVIPAEMAVTGIQDIKTALVKGRDLKIDWISFSNGTFTSKGNPLFRDCYTADPAPMVASDGRLYVFCGHDQQFDDKPGFEGQYGFNITDWLCYSTDDMKHWTAHGTVMKPTDFSWAVGEAWASQCIEVDGKYYFYVSCQSGDPNCKAIGVAVADRPEGPYRDAIGKALILDDMTPNGPRGWWNDFDPTVMIDDDGTPWLCWGNGTCFLAPLKKNMTELDGEIRILPMENYVEGPWLYKRGDWYYNVYASMGKNMETISYAMAPSVEGPWEFKGEITGEAKDSFTIHPGVIDYKGRSYLFYHNSTLSLEGYGPATGRRSVCVDELFYNPDGTIQRIIFKP